ncbi:ABC transporter D family member 1-like [Canna indica]|uniref:ABC transporter D family member 1-like n=1 Tax=Canna indica TaxID=4628 RepID=A0AAQ3KP05_9LILI|nr:ABC transporter D family member 1-like [Canna indica]
MLFELAHALRFLASVVSQSFLAFGDILELHKKFLELSGGINRIFELDELLDAAQSEASLPDTAVCTDANGLPAQDIISFCEVDIITPSQKLLARRLTCDIVQGKSLLVTGPNGSGKSSIFRALRGLWPVVSGRLLRPCSSVFYVPQRPYTSLGTLRDQIIYPLSREEAERRMITVLRTGDRSDASRLLGAHLKSILEDVRLVYLLEREGWDATTNWEDVLSLGEQQRLGMARLFFHHPKYGVLDECTNATSVDVEEHLFRLAREMGITVITSSQDDGLSFGFPSEPRALGDMNNNLDEQSDAMQNVAKLDNNLGQHANNFDRFIFEGQQTMREVLQPEGNNYVSQVDCDQDSADLDISPSQNDSKIQTVENDSPCPTPLNLIDEMQTPGTIYPVNSENRRTAQCNMIHTQYIYPVLKPVENLPHRVSLRQGPALLAQSDDCFEQQLKIGTTDSTERKNKVLVGADHEDSNFINSKLSFPYIHRNHDGNLISSTLKSMHKNTPCDLTPLFDSSDQVNIEPETPELIISNVSKWLKPEPLYNEKGLIMHVPNNLGDDRPIIETIAAHWADTVPFPKSPMFWGLNGIPNSTNKYKEDQKVSWHATPFEERLEKVLSDEKHLPQK